MLRETKSIPPLIFAIENLERFLMTLGKKCKINLLSGHKLPTSRDFRIKSALVKEALARKDENDSFHETQVGLQAVLTTMSMKISQSNLKGSDTESVDEDASVSKRARPEVSP